MRERKLLKERLVSLQRAKTDLNMMVTNTQNELNRRMREREELLELMQRQSSQVRKLCNKRTKIVSLKEFKTLKLVLRMNEANYRNVVDLINKTKKLLSNHQTKLSEVESGISEVTQQLENTPEMGQLIPFRRAL